MGERIHPETGATLLRGVRRQTIRYGALARELDVPGWYPEEEGDGLHDGSGMAEADSIFRELRDDCGACSSRAATA